jgi:hypothetical protein
VYIRPFDGSTFGPVSFRQDVSGADGWRDWNWDGKTASLQLSRTDKLTFTCDRLTETPLDLNHSLKKFQQRMHGGVGTGTAMWLRL